MKNERLNKQIDFIVEIDKTKEIFRQTYISNGKRKENDAEHAWHMALMAYLLKEYANEEIDVLKVMVMVLIHDIVEIDAGDTYAYGNDGKDSKRQREVAAAERIFNILPKEQAQEIYDIWEEFEGYETPEAKFAHMLDNFQPLLLNDKTDGLSWREHKVKKSQVKKRNERSKEGAETIAACIEDIIENNVKKKNLLDQ